MKILFMGTPEFALSSMKELEKYHEIIGVFTKVDKPNLRGGKIKYTPVKEYAIEKNYPVYQPEKLSDKEVVSLIREMNPDLIVVVAYGKIIPNEIIEIPKNGIINVHSSLLPKYRGAAPINAALIHGESMTGVSVMYIVEKLDAGDVIISSEIPIDEEDNFLTLHDKLKELGANTLIEGIKLIEQNKVKRVKQDESKVTFVKPFKKEDLHINWNKSEREIFNFVRGTSPFPGAFSHIEDTDKLLKIYKVKENFKEYEVGQVGQVVEILKGLGPVIKVNDGSIVILEGKPENKKNQNGNDIVNGNVLKLGYRLN
ncbi:methionyl-tRNA formyltransferase [Fusobacterium sp. PH5-44]|uniref:methionyl-tRNA formyltransferase n=1 Tax=unclassified Fusobacterium TaxID=2648384 RepID=UPI003D236AB6